MEEPINKQLYVARNELDAAEATDPALRKALKGVVAAIWFFAEWVQKLEENQYGDWYTTEDKRALRGLALVLSLVKTVHIAKAGRLRDVDLMGTAATTLAEMRKLLGVLEANGLVEVGTLLRLEEPNDLEGRRTLETWRVDPKGNVTPKPKVGTKEERKARKGAWKSAGKLVKLDLGIPEHPDFIDAYRVDKHTGSLHLKDPDGPPPLGSDKAFRKLFGRPPGRPKQDRDDVQAVLEAIRAAPGLNVRALCEATKMKTEVVTAAYKQLEADGRVRHEPGPRRSKRLFPVFP